MDREIDRLVRNGGRIIIDHSGKDVQAFGYADRLADEPLKFGAGATVHEALGALEYRLGMTPVNARTY